MEFLSPPPPWAPKTERDVEELTPATKFHCCCFAARPIIRAVGPVTTAPAAAGRPLRERGSQACRAPSSVPATRSVGFLVEGVEEGAEAEEERKASAETFVLLLLPPPPPPGVAGTFITTFCLSENASFSGE